VLEDRAKVTLAQPLFSPQSHGIQASHIGWVRTHGLTQTRELVLSNNGRQLSGQDDLTALAPDDRAKLADVLSRSGGHLDFTLHFHLHPDVQAEIDMGGTAVSLILKSGEVWVFRHDPGVQLKLEPSVYLEKGRLKPRASQQIVLAGALRENEMRIGWTLAKAQDTPLAIRDTGVD
jgi:uncharacterized heparinase superfamily protein